MSQELHLLVCGSRTITDRNWIFSQIEKYYHENFENFDIYLSNKYQTNISSNHIISIALKSLIIHNQ